MDIPPEQDPVLPPPSTELVVRPAPPPVPAAPLRQRVAALRSRLPELARHPAVIAAAAVTATVAAQVLLSMARQGTVGGTAAAAAPLPVPVAPPAAPLVVRAYVVQHVHVIHHLASARPPAG